MVMVIHSLLLRSCTPPLGQSEPALHTTPFLSWRTRRAFEKKVLYDLDHHPFHWSGIDLGPLRQEEGLVDLLPELQGLGRLGEGQPEGPAPTSWRWTTTAGAPTTNRTTIPSLSQKRRQASQKEDVYDHDQQPFPFQKRVTSQELIWGLFVKKPFPFPAEEESF